MHGVLSFIKQRVDVAVPVVGFVFTGTALRSVVPHMHTTDNYLEL
jgi:hypothetical protein